MTEVEKTTANEIMFLKLAEGLDNTSKLTKALLFEIKEGEADFATMKTELGTLKENVSYLKKIIVEGNGSSLLTKIALIDQKIETLSKDLESAEENNQGLEKTLDTLTSDFEDLERRFRNLEQKVTVYVNKLDEKEKHEQDEMRVSIARSRELEEAEKKNRAEIKKERTLTFLKIAGVVVAALCAAAFTALGLG